MKPIPQEWIKAYIDQMLAIVERLGPDSVMGKATLLRVDHVMDMVEAFRESQK